MLNESRFSILFRSILDQFKDLVSVCSKNIGRDLVLLDVLCMSFMTGHLLLEYLLRTNKNLVQTNHECLLLGAEFHANNTLKNQCEWIHVNKMKCSGIYARHLVCCMLLWMPLTKDIHQKTSWSSLAIFFIVQQFELYTLSFHFTRNCSLFCSVTAKFCVANPSNGIVHCLNHRL